MMTRVLSWIRIALLVLIILIGNFSGVAFAETTAERKARLEAELAQLEDEIKEQEKYLSEQRKKTGSIQRDLDIVQAEIDKKRSEIKQKNIVIGRLSSEIAEKNSTINDLNEELGREKTALARLLRQVNEAEDRSFFEFLVDDGAISDIFSDIDRYQSLQAQLQHSSYRLLELKELTAAEKEALEQKKNAEADVKYAIEQDKKKVEVKKDEKEVLLDASKSQEKSYEQVIAERKARAAEIRAALFELRGQAGISFGQAYDYAVEASGKTGVPAAFILAILKQESNIGKNVGTCNRPGDTLKWRDIMPGPNDGSWRDDQTNYLDITSRLGINPEGQPLSCPITRNGQPYGWGGAMGPSQFIPTTWKSYENRVASLVGASIANPWNPRHAIHATALYTQDLGANAATYTAMKQAACKYYSGRACSDISNSYGVGVMNHMTAIQAQIDVLESV